MSFTLADIEDLTRLLEEQPEWRVRIRRLLLSGEPPNVWRWNSGLTSGSRR